MPISVPVVPRPATRWVNAPARLAPDLRTGAGEVGGGVGGVAVLVGVEVAVTARAGPLARLPDGPVGAVVGVAEVTVAP